jgi:hypothetical protein
VISRDLSTGRGDGFLTIWVIKRKEGSLQASAAPASALNTPKVAKLLQAAWSIRKNPHIKML